jgi:hypothetical protein
MQKHCKCKRLSLRCCKDRWRLMYANSRFCSSAESRYSPIEGEALAVAWGLERGKYFLLGCRDLVICVDHKPLVGLYAEDKALSDTENPRLRNLAEKAGRFKFTTFHIPGVLNNIPDSLSRCPVGEPVHLNLEGEDCGGLDGLSVERGSRGPRLESEVQEVVCTGELRPITEWAAVEQFAQLGLAGPSQATDLKNEAGQGCGGVRRKGAATSSWTGRGASCHTQPGVEGRSLAGDFENRVGRGEGGPSRAADLKNVVGSAGGGQNRAADLKTVAGQGGEPVTVSLAVLRDSLVDSPGDLHSGEDQSLAKEILYLMDGQMEYLNAEEQEESDRREDEVITGCLWSFESDERGFWLGLEPRVSTWKRVQEAALCDAGYQALLEAGGGKWRQVELSVVDRVLMYGDRVVMPEALRREALGTLHAGGYEYVG